MYNIDFTSEARIGLAKLEKSEPKLFAKVSAFVEDKSFSQKKFPDVFDYPITYSPHQSFSAIAHKVFRLCDDLNREEHLSHFLFLDEK